MKESTKKSENIRGIKIKMQFHKDFDPNCVFPSRWVNVA